MKLTASQIRFLLAMLSLTRMGEEVASKNIAKLLGVTRPSVHGMIDQMIKRGLMEKPHYGAARLTQEGTRLAQALEEQQDRLTMLFARRLGLPVDEAGTAATALMSELREESLARLAAAAPGAPEAAG